jgi:two-component system LytT family response regulator
MTQPQPVTPKIRAVVVDDEELGRDRIQTLLGEQSDVDIVGVCADGPSAVETIEREQPDLVFLDVQMPGMNGFEVIENLDPTRLPAVVFVTAHDGHAIQAFEIHALDFLLKPFDQTRFEKALERARTQIAGKQGQVMDSRLVSLLEELRDAVPRPTASAVRGARNQGSSAGDGCLARTRLRSSRPGDRRASGGGSLKTEQ